MTPRIFGITLARNEADIVAETLVAASSWCAGVFVLDNGSTDGTWELVNDLASAHDNIVPFRQTHEPFRRTFRADIFQAFRGEARVADWWCVLDADEIYVDDPVSFLAGVPDGYNSVDASSYQYYFTDADLKEYTADRDAWLARPAADRLRYYRNNYSERRFLRHEARMHWTDTERPDRTPVVYPRRIRLRHYQYRSPEQIAERLATRRASSQGVFAHEKTPQGDLYVPCDPALLAREPWRERLADSSRLDYDTGDGELVARDDDLRPIPSPPSPLVRRTDAVRRSLRRTIRAGRR